MKNFFTILVFVIPFIVTGQSLQKDKKTAFSSENLYEENFKPGVIILKIKPEYRNLAKSNSIEIPALSKEFQQLGVSTIRKKFPEELPVLKKNNERNEQLVDLSLIYEIDIPETHSLDKAIKKLYNTGVIAYAEPYYIPKLLYTPSDPDNALQYSLSIMKVFDAWNISKGDTNVVIGIVDTGTDFDHPDLKKSIKYNYNDLINGIDDDGDGYIDNFKGWDLGEDDNEPQINQGAHGAHVSGIAAAVTDNDTGIAGVGFKCKYLPVKVSNENGALVSAYDGIVYAANQGCQIINCSWGSTDGGQYGQDIINYATFNKNALVVGAAGNNSNDKKFYPAAYQNVLSVGATNQDDKKWSGSSYGYYVDVCAPGESVFSTMPENDYGTSSGTSMAAPNVAGAAAIVKSFFPSLSALQIGEQLKVTADNIYPGNTSYQKSELGTGRINLLRALTETNIPSVVLTRSVFTGNANRGYQPGDTLKLSCFFKNYLAPASNLTVSLKANNSYIKVLDGSSYLGAMNTLDTADNSADPFLITILKDAPVNAEALFTVSLESGDYKADYYVTCNVNVDFINIEVNDIGTTITSSGRVGYNDQKERSGLGLTYLDYPSLLYEAGLMVGVSENAVSSNVRGQKGEINKDFSSVLKATNRPLKISDFDLEGRFNDAAAATPINISVNHNAYAWASAGNRKFVIILYDIINKGNSTISNLYAGLFADWDIMNYDLNKIDYDVNHRMGYAWSTEQETLYAGIKLLSVTAPPVHYAIDNITGGGGGIDLVTGFENNKKFTSLSNIRHTAGLGPNGNDVIDVMSTGPFNLAPDDTAFIAFALIAGDNLDDLKQSALAAQYKYDYDIPHNRHHKPIDETEIWLGNCYPNPAKNTVTFEFYLPSSSIVELSIYNSVGQHIKILSSETFPQGLNVLTADASSFDAGVYFYRLRSGKIYKTGKLSIVK